MEDVCCLASRVLLDLHHFASSRIDEYGATLYVPLIPGTPSDTKSSGESRFVSTWNTSQPHLDVKRTKILVPYNFVSILLSYEMDYLNKVSTNLEVNNVRSILFY